MPSIWKQARSLADVVRTGTQSLPSHRQLPSGLSGPRVMTKTVGAWRRGHARSMAAR